MVEETLEEGRHLGEHWKDLGRKDLIEGKHLGDENIWRTEDLIVENIREETFGGGKI